MKLVRGIEEKVDMKQGKYGKGRVEESVGARRGERRRTLRKEEIG